MKHSRLAHANGVSRSILAVALAGFAAIPSVAAAQEGQSSDEGGALSEIIVTAQRRAENLQDVPISVSAVTAESLEETGVSVTRDLPQIVPSVQFTRSGASGLFFIRGVGTSNAAAGEEGANAVYVDGVYMGDLAQTINYFNNIERVEVLKGPQGTLFGRNATGGLIHVITQNPGDEFDARGQIGFANYDTLSGQAYIGGPISDQVGADLALTFTRQDEGWGRNRTRATDNQLGENWGARTKWVVDASDALQLTLAGDYWENEDNLGIGWRLGDGFVGSSGQVGPGGHDTTSNASSLTQQEIWGVSLTAEADLGFGTLTSITASRDATNNSAFDVDGGPLNLVTIAFESGSNTLQQEFRLASNDTDPLGWQVGAFYLHSEATNDQQQRGLAFAALSLQGNNILAALETDSYAVFGELDYSLTPSTHLTAGVRYTDETRQFNGSQTAVQLSGTLGTPGVARPELNYSEVTYRLALRQDLSDNINVYATINRGFKAGTFSLQSPLNAGVEPQYIDAYEVGLKSELFNRRLRLNLAGYHYDIDDLQIRSAAIGNPGSSVLVNAATVQVDGIDIEFEAAPTDALSIFGGLTFLDSTFDRFGGAPIATTPQAPIVYQNPVTCPAGQRGTRDPGLLGAGPRTGGTTTCFGDVSGNQTALSPEFAASLGASYVVPMGAESELRMTALYSYNDGYFFEPDNRASQDGYSLVNASIEYRFNERFGVEFWGRNLGDTDVIVQNLATGTGNVEVLGPPQTYGVNLKYDF